MTGSVLLDRAITLFSVASRRRKGAYIADYMRQYHLGTVLLVGSGGSWAEQSHVVERAVALSASLVVACDLHTHIDAPWLYVRGDALQLPFRRKAFDLVVSNAVIEHVGDEAAQRQFVAEHLRVGRHLVITTPNRWFPVESHTRTALLHWLPAWRARRSEYFTRLLSRRQFRRLLPRGVRIRGGLFGATLLAACPSRVILDGTEQHGC